MKKSFALVPILFVSSLSMTSCGVLAPFNGSQNIYDLTPVLNPVIDKDANTVEFGLYPQTRVLDEELIASLNTLQPSKTNGWYLYLNNYYAKIKGKIATYEVETRPSWYKQFSNGEEMIDGQEYWFKCEPIIWDIITKNDNDYIIKTHYLLDAHRFDDDSNDYSQSEIRTWLNGEFFDTAFALYNKSKVLISEVDNSASQTDESSVSLACENTFDKVYLKSFAEINPKANTSSSFPKADKNNEARMTDYAFAHGGYKITEDMGGGFWLRSPSLRSFQNRSEKPDAWYVESKFCNVLTDDVDMTDLVVQPIIKISSK